MSPPHDCLCQAGCWRLQRQLRKSFHQLGGGARPGGGEAVRGAGAGAHPHPQEAGAGRHRVQVGATTKFVNRLGTGMVNIHNSPNSSVLAPV